jgi:hypothetical protein
MARLRLNNISSFGATNPITFADGSTVTGTFSSAPGFATIVSPDYYALTIEPDTANEEVVYLTAFTSGATTGTFTRAREGSTGVAHSATAWVHSPTSADFVSLTVITATGAGTWTKPVGCTHVEVICVGAGGGGGGGAKSTTNGASANGGNGGNGGDVNRVTFRATDLGATVAYSVGAHGTGGAGATVAGQSGIIGIVGGDTWFGNSTEASAYCVAVGGTPGNPGLYNMGNIAQPAQNGQSPGGAGGLGGSAGAGSAPLSTGLSRGIYTSGGGGGGAELPGTGGFAGGNGGVPAVQPKATAPAGGAAGVVGTAGGVLPSAGQSYVSTGGGGGGGSNGGGSPGVGGAGGTGSGGGGGGGNDSAAGSAGGIGGDGLLVIVAW